MDLEVREYQSEMGRVPYCPFASVARNSTGRAVVKTRKRKNGGGEVSPNGSTQADRRHSDRFPIEREVRYKVLNKRSGEESGDGKTINISSSGVLFTSEHILLPGRRLELSISWPAQLNNRCALKLVARGRVVRFEDGRAAIEIQQYEFRTQSSAPVTPIAPKLVIN
jgi:hypothetical protein